MFSVIIPVYNKVKSIQATIESVLKQTYTGFEIIVINDGSTDGSEKEFGKFSDNRIRFFNQENRGVSATRNRGAQLAKHEFLHFLDADDELDVNFLEKVAELISMYPDCDVYATSFRFQKIDAVYERTLKFPFYRHGIVPDYFLGQLENHDQDFIIPSVVVLRKNIFVKAGGFDEKLSLGEDIDLWARIFPEGKLAFLNESLATYGDTDTERLTVIQGKKLRPERDFLFSIGKLKEREDKFPQMKKFMVRYRLLALRKYHLEGLHDEQVKKVLTQVKIKDFDPVSFVFYKIPPRFFLKMLYDLKHSKF